MALREEEFERLQNQLLELKTCNYTLAESVSRKDAHILMLQTRADDLEKELNKTQSLAKLNPLSFARSMADRKDAKEKELMQQLMHEVDQVNSKMESQEEEFKRTNETLKQEIYSLMNENQKLRDYVETSAPNGTEFLRHLNQQEMDVTPNTSPQSSPHKSSTTATLDAQQQDIDSSRNNHESMIESLNQEITSLQQQNKQLMQKVEESSADLQLFRSKAAEASELSEVRKVTIDEMKIHIEESRVKFEKEMDEVRERHAQEVHKMNHTIDSLSGVSRNLDQRTKALEEANKLIQMLKAQKSQLDVDLDQIRDEVKLTKEYYDSKINDLIRDHEAKMLLLQETQNSEISSLTDQMEDLKCEISRLQQEASDSIEDRKIHEKKAVMMMKELKKNLTSERKRAEKLQAKLQEFLSQNTTCDAFCFDDPSTNAGNSSSYGHLLMSTHPSQTSTPIKSNSSHALVVTGTGAGSAGGNRRTDADCSDGDKLNDTSSVGSWSFMSNSRNGNNNNNNCGSGTAAGAGDKDAGSAVSGSNLSNESNEIPSPSATATITTTTNPHSDAEKLQEAQKQLSTPSSSSRTTDVIAEKNSAVAYQKQQQLQKDMMSRRRSSKGRESVRHDDDEKDEDDDDGVVSQLCSELECENEHLVARISDLQQEKWQLEERVNQLLNQVDLLTMDNRNKGLIIEFYCMGSHPYPPSLHTNSAGNSSSPAIQFSNPFSSSSSSSSSSHHSSITTNSTHNHQHPAASHGSYHSMLRDKLTVRKVVDFIKDRGDENLKEINRKLQRMLEEMLTKNMFLQKDLEHLSNQVFNLSRQSIETAAAAAAPTAPHAATPTATASSSTTEPGPEPGSSPSSSS